MRIQTSSILKKPSSVLMAGTFASYGLGLLTAALQARILGPTGRGEVAIAIVPGTLAAMLLCCGLPDYFSREAARGTSPRALSRSALGLALAIGVVVMPGYIFLAQFQSPVGSTPWVLLVGFAALTPVFIYGYCISGMAIGVGAWRTSAVSRVVPNALAVAGLSVLYTTGGDAKEVGFLLITTGLAGSLMPLFIAELRPQRKADRTIQAAGLRFGLRGWPAGALALVSQRIDLLILTALATSAEVGYYAISATVAALLAAISNSMAMPARNRAAQGRTNELAERCASTIALTTLAACALIAALPSAVTVLLGTSFRPAIPTMIILIIAQVPLAGVIVLTQTLIGAGHPSKPLLGVSVSFVTTSAITLAAYGEFGETAAAVGSLAGAVLSLAVLVFTVQRHVSRQPFVRYFIPRLSIKLPSRGSND